MGRRMPPDFQKRISEGMKRYWQRRKENEKYCHAQHNDGECDWAKCPNPSRDILVGRCPLPRRERYEC